MCSLAKSSTICAKNAIMYLVRITSGALLLCDSACCPMITVECIAIAVEGVVVVRFCSSMDGRNDKGDMSRGRFA